MAESRHRTTIEIRADNRQALREINQVQSALGKASQSAGGLMGGGGGGGGGAAGGGPGGGASSGPPARSGGGAVGAQRAVGQALTGISGAYAGAMAGAMGGSATAGIGAIGQAITAGLAPIAGMLSQSKYGGARWAGMGMAAALPVIGGYWSGKQRAAAQYMQLMQQRSEMLANMQGVGVEGGIWARTQARGSAAFSPTGALTGAAIWGYKPEQAITMGTAFAKEVGRVITREERGMLTGQGAYSLWGMSRMGLSTGAAARFMGVTAEGGITKGPISNIAQALKKHIDLAWSRGLRGSKVDKWLSTIATATEGLAKQGLEIDPLKVFRFTNAMAFAGMKGMRPAAFTATMMGELGGARQQLLAPFKGLAQQAIIAQAARGGGGLMGTLERVGEMGPAEAFRAQSLLGKGASPYVLAALGMPLGIAQKGARGIAAGGAPGMGGGFMGYGESALATFDELQRTGITYGTQGRVQIMHQTWDRNMRTALMAQKKVQSAMASWGADSVKLIKDIADAAEGGSFFARFLLSDRNAKHVDGPANVDDILGRLCEVPVYRWTYKGDLSSRPHIGPMAQDFNAAFGLDAQRIIEVVDVIGVLFAAVQALARKVGADADR